MRPATNGLQLKQRLHKRAKARGMTFLGVADLGEAKDFIVEQGGESLSEYPFALSFGYRLLNTVVDNIRRHDDPTIAGHYWYYLYNIVNRQIDLTALELASLLQEAGYRAFIIPNSYALHSGKLAALFSHKLAAHLAGHGWIGKSALLITPEYGPRVRWGTVLTNARILPADKPLDGDRCSSCTQCIDNCPVGAFTGQHFDSSKPRSNIFNAHKCDEYIVPTISPESRLHCGMCVNVCLFGRTKR